MPFLGPNSGFDNSRSRQSGGIVPRSEPQRGASRRLAATPIPQFRVELVGAIFAQARTLSAS
jgi:hypothetical protein